MSKKQMLWIGLAVVAVIGLLIGGQIISKQKAEKKQQDNIQTALKLAIDFDYENNSWWKKEGGLLLPFTTDNVDATVYERTGENKDIYVVNVTSPKVDDSFDEQYERGRLKSLDNIKYAPLSGYLLVNMSTDTPSIVQLTDEEGEHWRGKTLTEINNYKVEQNPDATLESIYAGM